MQALSSNPLHCMDCNLEVRPEPLGLKDDQILSIAQWSAVYRALDALWLDSTEYESWSERELSDIHSPVNVRGLEIQKSLNQERPCYYWLFQTARPELLRACPLCGQDLIRRSKPSFMACFTCENCRIVTADDPGTPQSPTR